MKTRNFIIILFVCLFLFAGTAINTKAQKVELVVQTGHSSSVYSVSFIPNGNSLASGSEDKTIKIWDTESGKEVRTLEGHSDVINSVSFSPDGVTLASGSSDKTIKIWDTESGKELRTLKGHTDAINSVAFSPDGKYLASGGYDKTVKIWDVENGKVLNTLVGHSGTINSVAFNPDGRTLASGSDDNTVKIWDVENGRVLRTLAGHSAVVWSVAFSPNGKTIASGSWDRTIKLWDAESGKELQTLAGHSALVRSVTFGADGKILASGSSDLTIKLWDVESGRELRSLTGFPRGVLSVAFSSDGETLAFACDDNTIRIWDINKGNEIRTLAGSSRYVLSVAFSPDGKTLAFGSFHHSIMIWDAEGGKEVRTLTGHSNSIRSIVFNRDGKTLASGSDDTSIKIWDLASGRAIRTLTGHTGTIWSVAFSPDGKTLASGCEDKTVKIWDIERGKELRSLAGHTDTVYSIAFSPDGKTLVSGSWDKTIKLWDVESGQELRSLTGHVEPITSVAFSLDGKTVASGSDDQTIKIWDAGSGKELSTLMGHSNFVRSIVFSPDGKTLASGSYDKTIKIWDIGSGRLLNTLTGHSDFVRSVAFSPDALTLASGSLDRKLKIWNVATGKEICSLMALDENDWAVTTPDGRFDSNKIEDSQGLHWVVSDDPMKPIPLDIFMRDYYEPKLLPRLMRCNKLNNCEHEFKPLPNIAELNRVQPPVKITNVSLPDINHKVKVTVEVGKGVIKQKDCRMKRCESGVYDLRLFRDGQIVGTYPGNGQAELIRQSESLKTSIAEKDLWQKVSGIKLEKMASCKTGAAECTTQTFDVELPRGKDAADIEFTAYAFNEDRVKSQTAKWVWPKDVIAKLPKAQPIKPRAYIIAVGVNAYENSDFNLDFAADDARRMAEVVTQKLNATGQYETVTPVTLISDYETYGSQRRVTEKQATKEKFRAVLDLLAGKTVDRQLLSGVKNAEQIRKVTPDDLVLIMYSSHGYADRAGNFYFIPYDTGPGTGKVFTDTVRRHSISSDELSLWLRDVDAGELIMIVDACHSAAAIEGSDFKPGPMGSRGLGQLSYDKGMKILTATQSDNVALENNLIKQGLLTYALVQDGIESGQADFKPKDNVINISEWLSYGVDRVPKLYEEVQGGKIQSFGRAEAKQSTIVVAAQNGKSSGKSLDEVVIEAKAQQPSLFDFTRKRKDIPLVNVK